MDTHLHTHMTPTQQAAALAAGLSGRYGVARPPLLHAALQQSSSSHSQGGPLQERALLLQVFFCSFLKIKKWRLD